MPSLSIYPPWTGFIPFALWLAVLIGILPALDGVMGIYRLVKHRRAARRALKISTASGGAANDGLDR